MAEASPEELREHLEASAPELWRSIGILAERWIRPAIRKLDRRGEKPPKPKTFNDPVWGGVELFAHEVALVDSPLLQRLRGIRQLGMAHHVYPGATHSRFEHSIGAVEAAERMLRSLERNATYRHQYRSRRTPQTPADSMPPIEKPDRIAIRLGALLHDIGHGPFSHASEASLRARLSAEFDRVEDILKETFRFRGTLSTSESIAVLLILSAPMRELLIHNHFAAEVQQRDLSMPIAARVMGSPLYLDAGYLVGIINGALDADKLDYMARDSHYSGLPLGLDVSRLISKLEVITHADPDSPDHRRSAVLGAAKHAMGISRAGLGAYEQMIIARVFLYDRLYFHPKVRASDAMIDRLIAVAEEERGDAYSLEELMSTISDETTVATLGGTIRSGLMPSGGERAAQMELRVRTHDLYHRAFTFAERFVAGVPPSLGKEGEETRQLIWTSLRRHLASRKGLASVAAQIYELAQRLRSLGLWKHDSDLQPEHVIVDLAPSLKVTMTDESDRVTHVERTILTRDEDGSAMKPNLFFDPGKWSLAYETQKHAGYVFSPLEHVPAVATAARIVFFELFRTVMSDEASTAAKTHELPLADWVAAAADAGLCSRECYAALSQRDVVLKRIEESELIIPPAWATDDPEFGARIAKPLRQSFDRGFPASLHGAVIGLLEHLMHFVTSLERRGTFVNVDDMDERQLQTELRAYFENAGVDVREGEEVAGGETDLVYSRGPIVIENKKAATSTDKPHEEAHKHRWQPRRYSIAMCSSVAAVVMAYRPETELGILKLSERLRILPIVAGSERRAQIQVVVPYGYGVPSSAGKRGGSPRRGRSSKGRA